MGDMFERQPDYTKSFLKKAHDRVTRNLTVALETNSARRAHLQTKPSDIRSQYAQKFLQEVAKHFKETIVNDDTPHETAYCYKHARQCKVELLCVSCLRGQRYGNTAHDQPC
jgi:hypothetical protein